MNILPYIRTENIAHVVRTLQLKAGRKIIIYDSEEKKYHLRILKNQPYTPKAFCFSSIKPQWPKAIRQQVELEIYYGPGRHRRETQSIFT